MKYCFYHSPLGTLLIAARGGSLTGLWMDDQKYYASSLEDGAVEDEEDPVLKKAVSWLDRYFCGEKPDIAELSLQPEGSGFQRTVWKMLCRIPYGRTATYGAVARMVEAETGRKTSARAVGSAVGRNPISIIIPCHRVVGTNGNLTGYAGGIERKRRLLALEGA